MPEKQLKIKDLLLELQTVVAVGVEEVDESEALVLADCEIALVSQEVENFMRSD